MIKTYPLASIGLDEAKRFQFRLVDSVTRAFPGSEALSTGDSGLRRDLHKPLATSRVEMVIADFFGVERAVLVQGAGTGALRSAFMTEAEIAAACAFSKKYRADRKSVV